MYYLVLIYILLTEKLLHEFVVRGKFLNFIFTGAPMGADCSVCRPIGDVVFNLGQTTTILDTTVSCCAGVFSSK